ncbi:methylated-DNA-[protein]-cysteine S-methyltransferase [Paenibacillus endophyticus]|uniref:methylated-DNA--[protein]-cysteine S-methyltransferase n=1 Tax=Paenibacillus endophyticus TaxID=1294268 RepID=A0A7W5CCH6_9BACL|nr:methylated-DNA--[protein]-cysteine S-methyltransferase [Paenibacillus endophyticus]MBB3155181.1 methylated-DNA-[protein]-cysteine S-methyltransferase [Paenibacillus endophyticus]
MIYKKDSPQLYWSTLAYEDWHIHLAATPQGLCFAGSQNQPFEELAEWMGKKLPEYRLVRDDAALEPFRNELIEYLQGVRTGFTIPFDCQGTPFQLEVWQALSDIPYGQTKSYSDIASLIRRPSAVRAVGTAIGANPILITIPCHRVIGKNGALTGYRGGIEMKTRLLQLESAAISRERIGAHG